MKKTIRYLENGEYHYATVKDVGDIAKLKTDSKDDLVAAINELYLTGGIAKPVGYDDLVKKVTDNIEKQQDIDKKVDDVKRDSEANKAEVEQLVEEQKRKAEELRQSILRLNELAEKASQDAKRLEDNASSLQDDIDKKFNSVSESVKQTNAQLDNSSKQLQKELSDTKQDLENTKSRLQNNESGLDANRQQIQRAEIELEKTKTELQSKASTESLDTVTQSVEKLDAQVKQNAKGIEVAVKRDELSGNVASLLHDKTNLLLGTRSFSGEDNWKNRDTATIEPGYYKGLKSAAIQSTDSSIYQPYHIKANTAYTFSFFGKEDKDNPKATLIIKPIDAPNINIDNEEQPVHITTEWQRFAVTFSVDKECDISIQIIQGPETTNNVLHLAGLKLQYGQNDTPWEPNEADVAENIEHTESQFNVYSDQITGIVKKQEKMGDTERQLDTRITETAEGLKQTSKDLQNANGKITEFKGQLESTAKGLKTEYEKYTNEAIGQISDSSLNLIHNSAFSSQDNQFESWQNISAKATVKEDSNNLHWVELTQSGQGTDNPIGVTSNYFIVKQGKVTVAVDVKLGDKANLDNQNILLLELYDESKKRVDFTDVSVSQLGLSMSVLNDHNVHRGLYRLGIDRKDVKYMTVKAILHRNGDLWLTNFSARLSSIDDGGYTPNPDDVNHQILKMNTKIEEDAEEVAIKANSVDVTRDIKSAVDGIQVGTSNLLHHSDTFEGWTKGDSVTVTSDKYLDGRIAVLGGAGVNGGQLTTHLDGPYNDELVTWVVYAKADNAGDKMHTELWGGGGYTDQSLTTQWQAYKFSGHRNINHPDIFYLWGCVGNKGNIYVALPFAVVGNKVGTWSPNPQDTSEEIKSAKDAAIQVASAQINIHVNEISNQFDDKLNRRINEQKTAYEKITSDGIEQTVRKITDVQNNVNNLKEKVDSNNGGGINLQKGTKDCSFQIGTNGKPSSIETYNSDTKMIHTQNGGFYTSYSDSSFVPTPGEFYTISADVKGDGAINGSGFRYEGGNNGTMGNVTLSDTWQRIINTVHVDRVQGQWVIYPSNSKNLYVKHIKIERGTIATPWTPALEDAESTHTLETANIDDMKNQGHYFVHNLTGNPIPGWVYVDVTGNGLDRIRQDVYADNSTKHMYRRLFGSSWSDWEQGAYISDVNNLKTETTASVKNLGDRVITEVNSVTKKINDSHTNDVELIRNNNFPDGNKGSWNGNLTTVIDGNNIPAELGQNGMKVLRVIQRDTYEDDIWYSVKPGEIFDVDYWIWPTGSYDSQLGLYFVDKDKGSSTWRGVVAKKGTGWTHYTGTIEAPSNAAFAKPWIWIDKVASETDSAAWIGKPSIRRHDNFAEKKISEINTKLEVANGKINASVSETRVNDILNSKGYATQSWAQSNFRMKSDSIDLEVRKITDPISNKLNNLQVGGRNLVTGTEQDIIIDDTANTGTQGWRFWVFNLTQQPKVGDQITVSSESTLTGKGNLGSYEIILYNSTTTANRSNSRRLTAGKRSSATLEVTNLNGTGDTVLLIYAGNIGDTEGKKNVIHHLKVEFGNVATDWTPAPEDINKKIDTQVLDSANIDNMRTQGHYFVHNLTGNPIPGWVYVDVTGNNNDRIRQDVYGDQSYVHKFRSWNGSRWTNWEEEVKNTDIITKINMSPEEIKLSSNKIEIDGNTYIHGELNVPTVKLNGHNGSIDLSGDGIHIGGPDGDIKLDSGGIDITKNGQGLSITGDYIQVVTDSNGQKEITGLIGSSFNLKNKNQNGLALLVTPQQDLGRPYGGDIITIGALQKNGEVMSAVTFDATNITGDGAGFHWTAPHYLHGPAQAIHITETQDNLTLLPLKMPHSSQENYYQPALTVTHGVDGNGNYVHGDSGVEFLWSSIKPYGSVDMTDARLWVYGVDHGIKNVWVSWSNWDGGERYPALVNDIGYWGGIAFPKSGRVTLFDADGRYYTPDRNTGIGAYDNYMGKNNWH